MLNKIIIKGAKENNLKQVDLELPKNKLIVFTGVSGSGKSSLAFDTIFAEGQRRYVESLSSYARQFLGVMEKPNVEYIEGLSPAISIDQKSSSHNPRSTVGTITEIYDYMRLLFAKIGIPHCPNCNKPITATHIEQMVDMILDWQEESEIEIYSPIARGKKGEYTKVLHDLYIEGYSKANINGKIENLNKPINLSRYKNHTIEILIDSLKINSSNISQITEDFEYAAKLSGGIVKIVNKNTKQQKIFNEHAMCTDCEITFPELEPRLFSFNSPFGACDNCHGLGTKQEFDPDLIIPDIKKTISEGAVMPYNYHQGYYGGIIRSVSKKLGYETHTRIKDWDKKDIQYLLYGSGHKEKIKVNFFGTGGMHSYWFNFNGLINMLEKRYQETDSSSVRNQLENYMRIFDCPVCSGKRLKNEALLVKINNKNISDLTNQSIRDTLNWFKKIKLSKKEQLISQKILKEINTRLDFLISVGLDYLTLNRKASTLAGGEAQRIRLASQIGSALTGVLYVLDEPSIGLHARDQKKLIDILIKLKNLGNTVIAVEHDLDTMLSADYLVDIGPKAGHLGGKVVAQGSINDIKKATDSLTGQYLSKKKTISTPSKRRKISGDFITITGASEHNLKKIKVHFPLGVFTCVTGVSGSGKSTLVNDILYKSLSRKINKSNIVPGKHFNIEGEDKIKKIIDIDQSPIGRTPRSNPATYTGVFTSIRELFSSTKDAKKRGYSSGRFSFNVYGGRCETCKGDGCLKIEMQFLPDVYIPCDVCKGKRYNKETLEVRYKQKNISDVLNMSVTEALHFFQNIPKIADKLRTLYDIGLGYIKLGQAATTISGGEAQRVKLATELSKRQGGKNLYILDEPTTGLHFFDVAKLLNILNMLVDAGNTIVVIEHNMDIIKSADHIIDLGPEGGDKGGSIVATGTPEDIIKYDSSHTGTFLKKYLH
jgi:excinuclease ABC subunit A